MKKASQPYITIAVVIVVVLFTAKAYSVQKSFAILWLIGIALGYVLYRSGICFAAMFQNLFLFRDYSMTRAILIMILVSLLGTGLLQISAHTQGLPIPGRIHSVGFHTAIGGFLFGIGMVLAGSCASGTLQRLGEGFILFFLVLLGLIIGSTFGAYHFAWWKHTFFSHPPVFLPDSLGWPLSLAVSAVAIMVLLALTLLLDKKALRKIKEWKKCLRKN